jgi:hypothetical protein
MAIAMQCCFLFIGTVMAKKSDISIFKVMGVAFLLSFGGTSHAATDRDNLQVYGVVPGGGGQIVLDGKLDELEWRKASAMGEFHFNGTTRPGSERRPTMVRALWTKDALFVAAECVENEMPAKGAAIRGDIEVMLESGQTQQRYYKFIVHSDGSSEALFLRSTDQIDMGWGVRSGFECAVGMDKDRWVVEMKIPFRAMTAQPQLGDLWLCNVRRFSFMKAFEDSSWAAGATWFTPNRFGYLYFLPDAGSFNMATLLELSDRRGLPVEVMSGQGRMIVRSNASILDDTLRDARLALTCAAGWLKRVKIADEKETKIGKQIDELELKLTDLSSRRVDGPVSAQTMSAIFLPTQEIKRQSQEIVKEIQCAGMSASN